MVALAGCGLTSGAGSSSSDQPALEVVATTTVLADLATNVGGDLVRVHSLVPVGADVHTFRSTPTDSQTIGQADVIVYNGVLLDDFLLPVVESARQPGSSLVMAAQGLEHLAEQSEDEHEEGEHDEHEEHEEEEHDEHEEHEEEEHEESDGDHDEHEEEEHEESDGDHDEHEEEEHEESDGGHDEHEEDEHGHSGHAHGHGDPHFWLDPILAKHYVEQIRDGLVAADPENAKVYEANANAYLEQLDLLDQEIAETLSQVPPERRRLVTFHDAYGHFARRYDWRISAFVAGDASDVSPGDVVQVLDDIKEEGIPAVFIEPQFNYDVMEQASLDAGVKVGIMRSLVDDEVGSYLEMMRTNAKTMAENLK